MLTDENLIRVYDEAYKYLSDLAGKNVLEAELNHYSACKSTSLNNVFRGMLISLKNKQGYMNFIGDVDDMKDILLNHDPKAVYEAYGSDWEKLIGLFAGKFGGKYKIDPKNNKNSWVIYSKGVLSCARFLSRFASVEDFDRFVQSFIYNEYTIAALPMVLDREIYGFGFALACDFLKEQGYTKYAKPDIHLKDIFTALGMVEGDSEYEIFKQVVHISKLIHQEPVVVDKVFWLIGSGNFNTQQIQIGRQKDKFIEYAKYLLGK